MRPVFARAATALLVSAALAGPVLSHPSAEEAASAHFLANEAVMVTAGETRILFDPLFTHSYGYPLIAPDVKAQLMAGEAPYDGVDAVFVSHIHGDHFDAAELNTYLATHPDVQLVAPHQARLDMQAAPGWDPAFEARFHVMPFVSAPNALVLEVDGDAEAIRVEAVHIPHAGGPGRAGIQNMVYRVTLNDEATVMHMGDATPDAQPYRTHHDHFQARTTHNAFPPYWLISRWGGDTARERLNAHHVTGVHIPMNLPAELYGSQEDYFTQPGETRGIHGHE